MARTADRTHLPWLIAALCFAWATFMTFNVLTGGGGGGTDGDGVHEKSHRGLSLSTLGRRGFDLRGVAAADLETELEFRRAGGDQVKVTKHEATATGVPRKAGKGGSYTKLTARATRKTQSKKAPQSAEPVGKTLATEENPGRGSIPTGNAELAFLHSTAPLPKSTYGRLNQLTEIAGFPNSPPIVLTTRNPKAYLFRNFLTESESSHLMDLAKKQLAPSTVVGTNGPVSSGIRTSAGTFLLKHQDDVVTQIELRIANAAGIPEPNGEGMQILRYDKGQKYDPHYDYFHDPVNASPKRGGQRMATMLIYLADTERLTLYFYNKSGGETIFPKAKKPAHFDDPDESGKIEWSDCASKSGVPLQSKRGDAVLFWSLTDDGVLDPGSLHGACPVVAGEKWTAVKWMRVAKFDGNFPADVPLPMPKLSLSQRKSDTSHETTARLADSSEGTEVSCRDEWRECAEWAQKGYCTRNPEFMIGQKGARDSKGPACPVSCGVRCGE